MQHTETHCNTLQHTATHCNSPKIMCQEHDYPNHPHHIMNLTSSIICIHVAFMSHSFMSHSFMSHSFMSMHSCRIHVAYTEETKLQDRVMASATTIKTTCMKSLIYIVYITEDTTRISKLHDDVTVRGKTRPPLLHPGE